MIWRQGLAVLRPYRNPSSPRSRGLAGNLSTSCGSGASALWPPGCVVPGLASSKDLSPGSRPRGHVSAPCSLVQLAAVLSDQFSIASR